MGSPYRGTLATGFGAARPGIPGGGAPAVWKRQMARMVTRSRDLLRAWRWIEEISCTAPWLHRGALICERLAELTRSTADDVAGRPVQRVASTSGPGRGGDGPSRPNGSAATWSVGPGERSEMPNTAARQIRPRHGTDPGQGIRERLSSQQPARVTGLAGRAERNLLQRLWGRTTGFRWSASGARPPPFARSETQVEHLPAGLKKAESETRWRDDLTRRLHTRLGAPAHPLATGSFAMLHRDSVSVKAHGSPWDAPFHGEVAPLDLLYRLRGFGPDLEESQSWTGSRPFDRPDPQRNKTQGSHREVVDTTLPRPQQGASATLRDGSANQPRAGLDTQGHGSGRVSDPGPASDPIQSPGKREDNRDPETSPPSALTRYGHGESRPELDATLPEFEATGLDTGAGQASSDRDLADRFRRILDEQARRHGIDV